MCLKLLDMLVAYLNHAYNIQMSRNVYNFLQISAYKQMASLSNLLEALQESPTLSQSGYDQQGLFKHLATSRTSGALSTQPGLFHFC